MPVLVDGMGARSPLQRIYLGSGNHNENWLQALIQDHPEILPMAEIEPGFGTLVAAAREVPCGHGLIDNLYLTASGEIVLVETKLWRNNEIRREVVAQALDYVSALTAMSFEDFQLAVSRGDGAPKRLYELVADDPDALDEAGFIDAVTANLRRGRMVVLVLGDGIRSETEALAQLLQGHAGAHFTFALVELATWRDRDGGILAIPNTLARTVLIERGIVRLESTGIRIDPVPPEARPRARSLSMRDFMGLMAERDPALPRAIDSLLDALEPLGIYPDLKGTLSFKAEFPELPRPVNFGYIDRQGRFWTDQLAAKVPEPIWRPYLETLAALIGGKVSEERSIAVTARNGSAPMIEQFLPAHHDAMVGAMEHAVRALREQAS